MTETRPGLVFIACYLLALLAAQVTCKRKCGTVSKLDQMNNGSYVPWHVGIFLNLEPEEEDNNYVVRCGGTILSRRVVISAAHCFVDHGLMVMESQLMVAVGQYKRHWNKPDSMTQHLGVQHIHMPDVDKKTPNNHQEHYRDLALLTLSESIVYTRHVVPICMDFSAKHQMFSQMARVAGWGPSRKSSSPSVNLKVFDVLALSRRACKRVLPNALKMHLSRDKFCARSINSESICEGDSGGGLVISRRANGEEQFYLQGVISFGRRHKKCSERRFAVFTNVQYYVKRIAQIMRTRRVRL